MKRGKAREIQLNAIHDRSRETAVVLQSKGSRIQRIVLQDVVDM